MLLKAYSWSESNKNNKGNITRWSGLHAFKHGCFCISQCSFSLVAATSFYVFLSIQSKVFDSKGGEAQAQLAQRGGISSWYRMFIAFYCCYFSVISIIAYFMEHNPQFPLNARQVVD